MFSSKITQVIAGSIALFIIVTSYGELRYLAGQRAFAEKVKEARKEAVNERTAIDSEMDNLDDIGLLEHALEFLRH